jgi:hypothetical protein
MTNPSHWDAWAAGLFEGEGSIEIIRAPRLRPGVRLHLNTTDHDVLLRFAEVVGCGSVREVKAPSVARPHWKTCWTWRTGRIEECGRLLMLWRPYLGERRAARVAEALDVLREKEAARWRTCYCGKHFRAAHTHQWACGAACRAEWQHARRQMEEAA